MFFFYHLKFQEMLSLINHFIHYLFIFMSLHLIRNDQFFAISQGISSNIPTLKRVSNNLTMARDMSQVSARERETESKFFMMYNTIIRTGESRALGAKYLNETRLPSNHDCLTWCLETPSCNVAVYEEKNMQSCYLFDCGPPVQCAVNSPCAVNLALCKFTAHDFFSSSILRMSQHSYELSQWGKEMQQERVNTEHESNAAFTSPVPPVRISTTSSTPVPPTRAIQSVKKGSICHHYQFQCVNSSECIAIYNVCDGIPQCPDGSDESAELKCPVKADIPVKQIPSDLNRGMGVPHPLENKPPVPKQGQPVPHPSSSFPRPQNVRPTEHKELQRKEDYKAGWSSPYSNSQMSKPGYHHHIDDSDGLGSPFIHKHSQFISANDPHVQSLNRWASDYDQYPPPHSTSLEQQYRDPYERVEEPSYLSNQLPADYDTQVKSYGGYRPEDLAYWPNQDDTSYTADEFPQPGMSNLNKMVSGYPDKESAYAQQMSRTAAEQYPETKLSVRKPIPIQNPPPEMDDYKLQRYSPHSRQQVAPYLAMEESLQQRLANSYPEIKSKGPFNPMQNVDDAMYNNDDLIRASIVNQLPKKIDLMNHPHEHDLKQFAKDKLHHPSKEPSVAEDLIVTKDNSFITVKPTSHAKAIQRTVLDFKMSVAELYESSSTHAHEANSAILALVVGVTVSFLLIILLVCRMKTLRRRMSRKGRALAHDADYLVNGMYL